MSHSARGGRSSLRWGRYASRGSSAGIGWPKRVGGFPCAADVHFMVIFGTNVDKVRRTGKLAS